MLANFQWMEKVKAKYFKNCIQRMKVYLSNFYLNGMQHLAHPFARIWKSQYSFWEQNRMSEGSAYRPPYLTEGGSYLGPLAIHKGYCQVKFCASVVVMSSSTSARLEKTNLGSRKFDPWASGRGREVTSYKALGWVRYGYWKWINFDFRLSRPFSGLCSGLLKGITGCKTLWTLWIFFTNHCFLWATRAAALQKQICSLNTQILSEMHHSLTEIISYETVSYFTSLGSSDITTEDTFA